MALRDNDRRKARLEAALKENLKRRKLQARAKEQGEANLGSSADTACERPIDGTTPRDRAPVLKAVAEVIRAVRG